MYQSPIPAVKIYVIDTLSIIINVLTNTNFVNRLPILSWTLNVMNRWYVKLNMMAATQAIKLEIT